MKTKRGTDTFDKNLGLKVYNTRKYYGWSQKELAEKIYVSIPQLQKYEKGTNRITVNRLNMIASAFGRDLSYFCDVEENKIEDISFDDVKLSVTRNLMKLDNLEHREIINSLIKSLLKLA